MTQQIQNGKGDSPRNLSKKYRDNYDEIDWGHTNIDDSKSWTKAAKHAREIRVRCNNMTTEEREAAGKLAMKIINKSRKNKKK